MQAAGSVLIIECAAPKSIANAGETAWRGPMVFRRTVVCHTNKQWSDGAKTRYLPAYLS